MLEYRDEYPKLPLVIIHLLDDMVKTKNQVMKDTIHELVAIIVTERNVDDFVEEDLLENEGTLVKSRLARGKAKFLGIVDKAYLMTVVKHAKRPNMYILVISGAEVETKTLNEEVEDLEENEITIPIEDENDREKAEELAEKLEECAITEFKVDEDGEDELSIIYTNGNKDKVEEILEECGVELSDENDEFDEDEEFTDYLNIEPSNPIKVKKFLEKLVKEYSSDFELDTSKKSEFTLKYNTKDIDIKEVVDDILKVDNKAILLGSEYSSKGKVGVKANPKRTGAYDEDEPLEEDEGKKQRIEVKVYLDDYNSTEKGKFKEICKKHNLRNTLEIDWDTENIYFFTATVIGSKETAITKVVKDLSKEFKIAKISGSKELAKELQDKFLYTGDDLPSIYNTDKKPKKSKMSGTSISKSNSTRVVKGKKG